MESRPAVACPACGAAVGADASFCTECGAALGLPCSGCQRGIRSDARFCPWCGAPNATAAAVAPTTPPRHEQEIPHGERRMASVLFADLSGYTSLNEALDPEEIARVMNRLKNGATRIVEAHGGTVNQFVGDEVMALFGVPSAHDDDPLRAVRAAIELRDHIREIGAELEPQLGTALRMHAGVNTGLMITQLRDRRDGLFGVTGDAINTAARLAEQAEPDEILIGPETHRAVRSCCATEPIGELRLRGRDQPILPHRVVRVDLAKDAAAALPAESAFVGRAAELEILERCFSAARDGRGRLVAVSGEAGVGKSRLCDEFTRRIDAGALVLRGHCRAFRSVAPYEPFLDVLRGALRSGGAEGLAVDRIVACVERELPGCREHLGTLLGLLSLHADAYPPPDADRTQSAILVALRAFFAELARTRPVVVVLSDWHWADRASELALHFCAETVDAQRVLVLVNFRPPYQPHWAATALRLELPALRIEDTRSIIHRIVGSAAPDALVQRVHERTGGNPLFVEEVSRALVDLADASRTDALVESVVPDNVAAVLRARIDRLPAPCVALLKLASVLGETFPLPLLRDVCEPDVDAASAFGGLVQAGLLQAEDGVAAVRFKHAIVRDVAYEMLLFQQRRALHGAVGCAIERREQAHLLEHVERLAHHFARSDDREKAVHYLVRSGDKAVASGAMYQALGLYFEAVRFLGEMPETPAQMRRRVDITLKLAHAAIYRPTKELRDVLRDCLGLSERLGDARASSYILYWMAFLENALGGWPAARDLFGQCLARAVQRRDEKLQALVYTNLGQTLFQYGEYGEAMQMIEDGVKMRRRVSGDSAAGPLVSYPMTYQAMIHAERGRFDLAEERLEEARSLACASGQIYTEAAVVGGRGVVELFRGSWPACRRSAAELERKSRRIGSTFMLALSQTLGGYARCFDGQRGEGVAMLREGVSMLEHSGIWMMISFAYACLAEALVLGGECEEAENLALRALEHLAHEDHAGEPGARRVLLLVAARRKPAARDLFDAALASALDAARRRGSARDEAITWLRASEALAERDPGWAREHLARCAERFRALQMPWYEEQSAALLARAGL
jgi:class 3 adenylate cyclase/tetratricopeptide (TPR) repeat protein